MYINLLYNISIYSYSKSSCCTPKTNTMLYVKYISIKLKKKKSTRDFPSGAIVKNLPANTGDRGSIPGPGRSHMSRSN